MVDGLRIFPAPQGVGKDIFNFCIEKMWNRECLLDFCVKSSSYFCSHNVPPASQCPVENEIFFDFEGRERTVHLHPNSNYDNLKPELPAGLG